MITFRPAERSQAKPLIGLYAESGAGKTYSALMLARGFVGPNGKIGMIETESGRGEAYAGTIPGSYAVLPMRDSFSPEEYGAAITTAEKAGLDALIIDSASHEWEGVGGVLDQAAKNLAAGKKGVLAWQQPKISHSRHFMLRLLGTSIPLVIVCMRAKYPMREVAKDGRKEWIRSEVLEPKQSDDILFEMATHGWIDHQHRLHVTRYQLPELREIIPDVQPITIQTGERLAAWARNEKPAVSRETPVTGIPVSEESPLALAEKAADGGTAALRVWWSGPGKVHQRAPGVSLAALKDRAALADAKPKEDGIEFDEDGGGVSPAEPLADGLPRGGNETLDTATQPLSGLNESRRDEIMKKIAAAPDAYEVDKIVKQNGTVLRMLNEQAPRLYDEVMDEVMRRKV